MEYQTNNNHSSLIDNQLKGFIQMTGSLRGRAKSTRPRRQVKKARKLILTKAESIFAWLSSFRAVAYDFTLRSYHPEGCLSYVENVFGRQRRYRALQPSVVELVIWISSTGVENIRQIRLFSQNKPNFPHFSPENKDLTQKQTQFKPNTKPKQTQFWGNIKGGKPNSNPIEPNNRLEDKHNVKIGKIEWIIYLDYKHRKRYNKRFKNDVSGVKTAENQSVSNEFFNDCEENTYDEIIS